MENSAGTPQRSSGRGSKSGGRGRGSSSRDTLMAAVALQDHIARTMRFGAVPKKRLMPSIEPGEPMTLAQTLGLIPRPPALLTESEWNEVHLKAQLRQDDREECPICQERFKADSQVLLSCSHVYHKQCLASYEKYARTRACPLCRAQQYQRIEIDDGARAYRTYCAILIQSFYRGHLARKKYKELRRHNPPKFSEAARRRWAAERLEEESEKMIKEMEGERGDMDDLFAELDAGLKQSREACEAVDSRHVAAIYSRLERQEEEEQRLFRSGWERGSDGSDVEVEAGGRLTAVDNGSLLGGHNEGGASGSIAMRDGEGRGGRGGGASCSSSTPIESATRSSLAREANRQIPSPQQRRTVLPLSMSGGKDEDGVDWGIILARGKERQAAGEEACPICIGPIGRRGQSGVAWLSCSHAFHIHCIMAFEAFELANNSTPSCPVCRMSGYKRRCFDES